MGYRKLAAKRQRLESILSAYDGLVVAFSGGVDSTFLLAIAHQVLGERVAAVTADSPLHPRREIAAATELARTLGVRHLLIPSDELELAEFTANHADRCYVCKRHVMAGVLKAAAGMGIRRVAHGVHVGDLCDYRPGLKAAAELGLEAPLLEAGLNQAEIRELSRRMRLATWKKPSMACLASRIPYGSRITRAALRMVEEAEDFLRDRGVAHCRVRHHGEVARIEVGGGSGARLLREPVRSELLKRFRAIGFTHVALDIEGYTPGSLNRSLGVAPETRKRAGREERYIMKHKRRRWVVFILVLGLASSLQVHAEFYKYVDKEGRTVYVDEIWKIPPEFLNQIGRSPEKFDHLPQDDKVSALESEQGRQQEIDQENQRRIQDRLAEMQQATALEQLRREELDQQRRSKAMETKVTIANNQILVPVVFRNGGLEATASLVLDTGATHTMLHRGFAAGLNIVTVQKGQTKLAGGQSVFSEVGRVELLQVGPVQARDFTVVMLPFEGEPTVYQGLLGMDFLSRVDYAIDFENQTIRWRLREP